MAMYDGVVTLSDNKVPVIVELNEDTVRLSASGTEIGEWSTAECDITKKDDDTYLIHAESEVLPFTPTQPGAFAAAVGLADVTATVALPPVATREKEHAVPVVAADAEVSDSVATAPPPQPLTMGLFYALCILTLGLGIWALISMVF